MPFLTITAGDDTMVAFVTMTLAEAKKAARRIARREQCPVTVTAVVGGRPKRFTARPGRRAD